MKVFGNIAQCVAPILLVSAAAQAQGHHSLAPSEPIRIKKIQYNGSGCPLGTVAQNVAEDKQAFTLTFSEFIAEAGPGVSLSAGRKNCVATLVLEVPSGWQYSIASFNYRGYIELDHGMKAQQSASYFFEGNGRQGTFGTTKGGPFSGDYVYSDSIGLASAVWSACGAERALNINSNIRVFNSNSGAYPNARGLITTDSVDGQIKQVWGITWKRC